MDQPKVERLLRIMKMLFGNVDLSIDEIARRLGTSARTVYRYIDTFKGAGFAVKRVYGNVYKLEEMPDNAPSLDKIVYFSEEESYLVNSLIDRLSPTNALKRGLKEKLAVIYDSTSVADFVDSKSNAAHVDRLKNAIMERRQVILHDYESGNSHTVKDRYVEPFAFTSDYIEIWAYDLQDFRNKVFKVQRIAEVEVLDRGWEFETSHRKQGRDVFGMSGRRACNVKLQLSVMAKNLLIEEHPLAEKDLTRDGNKWILDTPIYSFEGIGRFYVGLVDEIKILEGQEFIEYIAQYLKKFDSIVKS